MSPKSPPLSKNILEIMTTVAASNAPASRQPPSLPYPPSEFIPASCCIDIHPK
ncbi:hypothetical protein GLOTRDRAFT_132791 [Gloeophyllum trabeum ATCC 11539]|uniref:Uncharacterized protein n=1 Tax=Gloeophyllum trabeum (strain ATCC 11539 / FP-39264 / Madison 617) TaxID=670483 RepID=S7RAY3_GLOTA|nr:uncharacterized protein GLOTRDRAFT_132791 [Gloeophyllum trabeum ATCC 11539]EPQ51415.1 hypothetical protein GLOTRDRAFT_132791 [Gloeophyllum trabeum ATCC 11539]